MGHIRYEGLSEGPATVVGPLFIKDAVLRVSEYLS